MSRDGFFQLPLCLHFVNNLEISPETNDRLAKVGPLINSIKNWCRQLGLERHLCVDEQIIPFTGAINIKQYIKGKPCPWGIKIFVLCSQIGQTYDFLFYQGKSTPLDEENLTRFGQAASVLLHLAQSITKPGHKLFYDNYFSSYKLLNDDKAIKKEGTSEEVINTDGVVIVKWFDNRTVCLASNYVGKCVKDKVKRSDKKEAKYTTIERPEIIKDYNQSMGGVDLLDQCVHVGNHFKSCDLETEQSLIHKSKIMLSKMRKIWPYMDMDGYMNIWILKPTAGSRGIGIHICRTLAYVLRIVSERKTYKYIIQKYIERPLLIYNTKFDIRQWFLISSTSPLTIWMYKVCYLRFSSQTYNLRKLHESIHLTNNSVQCKYQNSNRDPALPEYNMWDSHKFKSYLEMIGYPNVFDEIIYPGMRQCITAAILIHQDYINTRKNSFELYGADFMLTEDFTPWLIEINSRPALHASTPITARMCPQVLEDVVKVIIDKTRNPNANTGSFELLYKEKLHQLPPLDPTGLQLQGKPLPQEFFYTPINDSSGSLQPEKLSSDIINISSTHTYMKYVSKQMKKTLENLLDIIHKERTRRQKLKTRRSYLTVQSGKIPIDLEKDSIQYVENINKVNDSIKEIQQILKPNFISDRKLQDLTATIEREELSTEKLSNKSSEVELTEICYSTPNVTKKIELNNTDTKYFLPKQTDEQLNKESAKIEEALNKINDSKSSMGYLIDFLKFLNVWGIKAAETMN
ncbi:tubulin monoglycylase ttll3 [Holotrichia oblita]|uniref:Tubulin monoglycylase ttll3 n=1 Tax=Holotrichia oblita TaxID=644536 RepID=A0ACB9TCA4_HOLOL|nr:tubulin monoglycylase ttll3 [Holotrichia oblita]